VRVQGLLVVEGVVGKHGRLFELIPFKKEEAAGDVA
jgi:hypothetical protein